MGSQILKNGIIKASGSNVNANLCKGTNTNSSTTNNFGYGEQTGGSTKSIEIINNIYCAKITRNTTAHSGWAFLYYSNLDYNSIKTSTIYTVSFDLIGSGSGTITFAGFQMSNATNNMSASTTIIQNEFDSSKWSHIVFRTRTKDSFDGITLSGQLVYMNTAYLQNTSVWIMMKNMKVEEGDIDTPWLPNSSDEYYNGMVCGFSEMKPTNAMIGSDYIITSELKEV